MTCLGEGCPLVVAVEPESELAQFATSSNIGVAVSPDSPQKFVQQLVEFTENKAGHVAMKAPIARISHDYFEPEVALEKLTALLANIDTPKEKINV